MTTIYCFFVSQMFKIQLTFDSTGQLLKQQKLVLDEDTYTKGLYDECKFACTI